MSLSLEAALDKAEAHLVKGEIGESHKIFRSILIDFPKNERAKKGFEKFFKYRILPYKLSKETPIYFIGSIAHYFREILDGVAMKNGLEITGVIQRPIDNLLDYHKNNIN